MRENAKNLISEHKKKTKNSEPSQTSDVVDLSISTQLPTIQNDSQIPICDTTQSQSQPQTPIECENAQNMKELKRKFDSSISDECEDEDDDNCDNLSNAKRSKLSYDELITAIKDERSQHEKERALLMETLEAINNNLELERKLRLQERKEYLEKFEQIDKAFQTITSKIDKVSVTTNQIQQESRNQHYEFGLALESIEKVVHSNAGSTPPPPLPPCQQPPLEGFIQLADFFFSHPSKGTSKIDFLTKNLA